MNQIIDAEQTQYQDLIKSLDIPAKSNAYPVIDGEQRYSLRRER